MSAPTRDLFDTGRDDERARLDADAALWDPFTFRRLAELDVQPDWRCLEVGAGTGTVARWLLDHLGDHGHIVATDLETRWLDGWNDPRLDVRRHDVVRDPLEADAFDVVHARLVLEHLRDPRAAAVKLVSALRPGGWLVAEDYDVRTVAMTDVDRTAWTALGDAMTAVMRGAGSDPHFGTRLPALFREIGVVDVDVDVHVRSVTAPELAAAFLPLFEGCRGPMIATGTVTSAALDAAFAEFEAHDAPIFTYTPLLVSARGRRPAIASPSSAAVR